MLKEAMQKLQAEVSASNDGFVTYVGNALQQHISKNPHHAGFIMTNGKTVTGSLKEMEAAAKKQAKNNRAMFTPDEGMAIVLKYFGIPAVSPAIAYSPVQKLTVSLDDLL